MNAFYVNPGLYLITAHSPFFSWLRLIAKLGDFNARHLESSFRSSQGTLGKIPLTKLSKQTCYLLPSHSIHCSSFWVT